MPDYYDLEELRDLLREEALSFCYIHEYVLGITSIINFLNKNFCLVDLSSCICLYLNVTATSFSAHFRYLGDNEAERYRNLFDQGRIRIMLISERYYFYRRYGLFAYYFFINKTRF